MATAETRLAILTFLVNVHGQSSAESMESEPNDPITHHTRALKGPATEEKGEMEVEMQFGAASEKEEQGGPDGLDRVPFFTFFFFFFPWSGGVGKEIREPRYDPARLATAYGYLEKPTAAAMALRAACSGIANTRTLHCQSLSAGPSTILACRLKILQQISKPVSNTQQ